MVGKVKKWMGIDVLERDFALLQQENLAMARVILVHRQRINEALEAAHVGQSMAIDNQKQLTAEPEQPKIEPKPAAPRRVNWRQAQAALEKASDPQEQEG